MHPPKKVRGKKTCLTNCRMLRQELPLDTGRFSGRSLGWSVNRQQWARTAAPALPSAHDGQINIRRAQQLDRARATATTTGAHSSSTECVRRPQQQVRTAAPPSAYDGHNNRRAQQLHRARTTATTTGAHSSSTERVRRPQ